MLRDVEPLLIIIIFILLPSLLIVLIKNLIPLKIRTIVIILIISIFLSLVILSGVFPELEKVSPVLLLIFLVLFPSLLIIIIRGLTPLKKAPVKIIFLIVLILLLILSIFILLFISFAWWYAQHEPLWFSITNHADTDYYLTIIVNDKTIAENRIIEKMSHVSIHKNMSEKEFSIYKDGKRPTFILQYKETPDSAPVLENTLYLFGGGMGYNLNYHPVLGKTTDYFSLIDIFFENDKIEVLYSDNIEDYPTHFRIPTKRE
ncbi:MAG: hypothetical protein LBI28_14970 [Treponema sp.]|nr:hypothetical protein [Treponema sp.]